MWAEVRRGPFWVEVDKCMLYLLHVLFPKHETGSKGNGGPTNWKKRKVLRKKKSQEDQSCSVHLEEQVWPRPDSSSQRRQEASTSLPQATWRSAWGWQGNKIHFRGVGNGGVWRRKDCDQRKKKNVEVKYFQVVHALEYKHTNGWWKCRSRSFGIDKEWWGKGLDGPLKHENLKAKSRFMVSQIHFSNI